MPRLSIVIPTFNSLPYVRETVRSALSQTRQDIEVVVDDNTSKDSTPEALENEFASDPRFKLFKNTEDLNIPNGWNRALSRATGDFCILVHSDNLLHPEYAEHVLTALDRFGADVAYTECLYFEGETPDTLFGALDSRAITYLSPGPRAVGYVFQFQRMIPTSCLTIRRTCLQSRVPFQPDFRWDPDIELMTWLAHSHSVIHLGANLAAIRTHGGQAPSWKDPAFSKQYRKLLERAQDMSPLEAHHFLIQWAGSNHDVCQRLSQLGRVPRALYFKYLKEWLHAEWDLFAFFLRGYARKWKLALRYSVSYLKTKSLT